MFLPFRFLKGTTSDFRQEILTYPQFENLCDLLQQLPLPGYFAFRLEDLAVDGRLFAGRQLSDKFSRNCSRPTCRDFAWGTLLTLIAMT